MATGRVRLGASRRQGPDRKSEPAPNAGEAPPGPNRSKRFARRAAITAPLAVCLLALLAALAYLQASTVRDHLLRARGAMENGQAELLEGRTEQASGSFAQARAQFTRASSVAHRPALRVLGWLPLIGRTSNTVAAISDAGDLVARAGQSLTGAVEKLPGGIAALAPKDGALPVEQIGSLAPAIIQAESLAGSALRAVDRTSGSLLPGPVGEARRQALQQLTSLVDRLTTARILLARLPTFLGADRPRRYFFAAQNPAELRGTGGFIGAYSILTVDRGRFSFSPFRDAADLPDIPLGQIGPPNPDYGRNYDLYGGPGFWPNINATPDFPSAALAIERLYGKVTGVPLDGVIASDPFALADLMAVTGPVDIPSLHIRVDASSVVALTTNGAYRLFTEGRLRKLVLGDTAKAVFERFMQGTGSPVEGARTLEEAAAEGHIVIHVLDPELERGLIRASIAGALRSRPGDFLSLVQNSASATKIDYYESRSVDYSVRLDLGGRSSATAQVTLVNDAPTQGEPGEVIGPFPGVTRAGEAVTVAGLYCGRSCHLAKAELNGIDVRLGFGQELGFPFHRAYLKIPAGGSARLRYSLSDVRAWEGDDTGGTYRLTFLNQTTIRPTHLRVEVRLPAGMAIMETNVPMQRVGGRAVWEGYPGRSLVLEVRFRRSLAGRVWRRIVDFLAKPVIHL